MRCAFHHCLLCLLTSAVLAAGCGDEMQVRIARHMDSPDRNSMEWVYLHSCYDQMHRSTFTWRSYRNLLDELKIERYVVVPLREFKEAREKHPGKVVVGMRHDMDGNFCKALTMAEIERRAGIRSTYYVNHTEPYYSYGWPRPQRIRGVLPHLRRLQDMGHEVGLHNDALTMAVIYGFEAAELLTEELGYLRDAGIDVVGTSAHGSVEGRELRFSNYELFAGMTKRTTLMYGHRRVPLGAHTLAEFGLEYEAYHVGYEDYYSDVGGRWSGDVVGGLKALGPGESIALLTHPQWWGAEEPDDKYY